MKVLSITQLCKLQSMHMLQQKLWHSLYEVTRLLSPFNLLKSEYQIISDQEYMKRSFKIRTSVNMLSSSDYEFQNQCKWHIVTSKRGVRLRLKKTRARKMIALTHDNMIITATNVLKWELVVFFSSWSVCVVFCVLLSTPVVIIPKKSKKIHFIITTTMYLFCSIEIHKSMNLL